MFDGASQLLVIRTASTTDTFVCYFYQRSVSYITGPGSPLYRKGLGEWTVQQRMEAKRRGKHTVLTKSYIENGCGSWD